MKHIKNILALSASVALIAFSIGSAVIPQSVIAQSDSEIVQVHLTVSAGITLTAATTTVNMDGLSTVDNESTGSVALNVKTNNVAGYSLEVEADTDEAMQHTDFGTNAAEFEDFNSGSATPSAWDTSKGSNVYTFGFSAFGPDTLDGTWGAGSSCGSGTIPTDLNYAGFNSTTQVEIAEGAAVTTTAGTDTTLCFGAEQVGVYAPSGAYNATITATATTL